MSLTSWSFGLGPGMWVRSLDHLDSMLIGYLVALEVHGMAEEFNFWPQGPFAEWLGRSWDDTARSDGLRRLSMKPERQTFIQWQSSSRTLMSTVSTTVDQDRPACRDSVKVPLTGTRKRAHCGSGGRV